MAKKLAITDALTKALGGNKELTVFFLTWLKHNRNATAAYKELHPNVTDDSARVLGSRVLAKIDIHTILEAYDLGHATYIDQLQQGLRANRVISAISGKEANGGTTDFIEVPDHKTRRDYHKALGKLLGIEKGNSTQVNTQINIYPKPILGGQADLPNDNSNEEVVEAEEEN